MKITVARFIFIEKPLFLSSAPKKKGFQKENGCLERLTRVWRRSQFHIGEPFSDFPPLTLVAYSTNYFTQIW